MQQKMEKLSFKKLQKKEKTGGKNAENTERLQKKLRTLQK